MTAAAATEPRRSRAEKFWDRFAARWDKPDEAPEQTDTKVTAKTKPYLKATDTVLDYGCATGNVDFRLAAAVKEIRGIDISPKMIAAANQIAEVGKIGNVSFAKATIFDEGLKQESFDVVLAFNIFHLLEDAEKAMRRIGELLRPGGLLISVTPCLGEHGTFAIRSVMVLVRLASALRVIPCVRSYKSAELQDSLGAAGLVTLETEELVHSTSEYFVVARKI